MDIPSSGLCLTHRHIVHPTDFSSGGDPAFRHALKLALAARAHFTLLHVDDAEEPDGFDQFPRVRPLLVQWGALPPNAPQEQVQALGLYVKKVRAASPNPALAVVQHLTTHPSDLVVLATHHRGRPQPLDSALGGRTDCPRRPDPHSPGAGRRRRIYS